MTSAVQTIDAMAAKNSELKDQLDLLKASIADVAPFCSGVLQVKPDDLQLFYETEDTKESS